MRVCVQAGKFSGTGASTCVNCQVGKYSDRDGSAECSPCAAGFYSEVSGASSCSTCAAGKFLDSKGSSKSSDCKLCAAGKYSTSGAESCTSCQHGASSPEGSSSITNCICIEGYSGPAGGTCTLWAKFENTSLEHSSTRMNANNRLILTLGVNLPIRDGTTIAITGLQGSQTSDGSVSVTLLDSSAELSPSNDNWRQTSGTLTTTVASVKSPTLKNIQLVFALRNPLVSQTAPLPTLTVTWDSGLVISQSLNGSRALLTCKTGFFGSNCQFKCQSPREVNIAGYCGCPRGSFGANCELTVTASGESQGLVQVGEAKNLKLKLRLQA